MDGGREEHDSDIHNGSRNVTSDYDRKRKNYKLIIDPILEHGHSNKVYRFEGVIPGDPDPEPVLVADPRSRIKRFWNKKEVIDLQVPRFKHDVYYVGTILPKEVSFSNLNDNINIDFLTNMCKGFGNIEDSKVYYHPKSKKHLGIGKVVFTSTRSAKLCADKLNQTSRMGMIINAVVDPFGKERSKWIDNAAGDQLLSPVHKSDSDHRVMHQKSASSSGSYRKRGEKLHSRRNVKSHQKETLSKSNKSDSKDSSIHSNHLQDHAQIKYGVLGAENESSHTSDSENYLKNKYLPEGPNIDLKEASEDVLAERDNREGNEWNKYSKHKHKDRYKSGHSEQQKEIHSRRRRAESQSSDDEIAVKENAVAEHMLESREGSGIDDGSGGLKGGVPRLQSLESRIQSLLGGLGPPSVDSVEDREVLEPEQPPLPLEPAPPILTDFPPPLPDEAAPPPLPPEPLPHHTHRLDSRLNHLLLHHNGHALIPHKRVSEEDDRMSLSSIESDEEKIEVNPPTIQADLPPPPQPPLPPLPPMPWQLPPPIEPVNPQTFQNHSSKLTFDQSNMNSSKSFNIPEMEEVTEGMFTDVLDQVINQLKFIMRKDLCKKMVQDTAFMTYDRWWTSEQNCDKSVRVPGGSGEAESGEPVVPSGPPSTTATTATMSTDPFRQTSAGMTGTIEALFDNKDGSGFGVGGLLGLRGGIPKMPSFRKKFLKPVTPPPEEDEDEHDFVGPRTPEQSESEDGKVSDSADDSVSESELKAFNEQRRKKVAIYSTDSELSDADQSAVSEVEQSESEEEEEEQSEGAGSVSDVDIETTSAHVPSPPSTREASPTWPVAPRQKATAAEPADKETQEIERATFPVLRGEESSDEEELAGGAGRRRFGMRPVHTTRPKEEARRPELPSQQVLQKQIELQQAQARSVSADHCYHFKDEPKKRPRDPLPAYPLEESDMTDSASEGEPDMIPCLPAHLALDHQYCAIYHPIDYALQYSKQRAKVLGQAFNPADFYAPLEPVSITDIAYETEIATDEVFKKYVNRTKARKALTDVTNLKGSRELMSLLPPEVTRKPIFKTRSFHEQQQCTYKFLYSGIDEEDINYLKRRYDELLQDDSPQTAWLNNVHWVEHSVTQIADPPVKRRRISLRPHHTGCARTEGYYKISHREKSVYLSDARGVNAYRTEQSQESMLYQLDKGRKQKAQQMREARSESRRWQTVLSSTGEDVGDLVKFNQLKFRKKALKFAKSGIHDWGLFALEPIASDEMVIEYVGQTIRQSTADLREKKYEQMGIGSSYMFRIDGDNIIDATKCGNLARFINHSCTPNCYAKIISVEGQKKIVIYSKTEIGVNEEITYDYKFPLEDEKIPCLCGTSACRGSLN